MKHTASYPGIQSILSSDLHVNQFQNQGTCEN